MTDLHNLTAREQAALIREREVSPRELTEHVLRRLDEKNPLVGAFVTAAPEQALAAAERAEKQLLEQAPLSPLHGVPTAVKDLNFVSGIRTTFGSAALPGFVPDFDDNVSTLIQGAGMVVVGKTSTAEFGAACYTEPEPAVGPSARTPWDTTRSAGGSSGGAAAAVAAGIVSVAHGSDAAGSIRIPASVCGLVGFKPSRGRVSSGPISGETTGLFANGVLARNVLDAATLLDVLAVPMPGDPFWMAPPQRPYTEQAAASPGPLMIGRHRTPPVADAEMHPECVRAWDEATELLVELGHQVEDVPGPFPTDLVPVFELLFATTAASLPLDPEQCGQLQPLTAWLRERGEQVSGPDLMRANASVQQLSRRVAASLARYDAILTPTLAQPPALIGQFLDDDPAANLAKQERFSPFAACYNVTGQPAVSLPLTWSTDGLPIGVMLAAPSGCDGQLLALAHQMETARPWAHRRPPVW